MNDSSITTPHTTTITQGPTPSTTTKRKFFEQLTSFEADMLTVGIGCFVLVIAFIAAVFAYRKRQSEKRHLLHRLEGHLELSLSATSDIGEAYTLSPYVQHILDKSGSASRHGLGESLGSTQPVSAPGKGLPGMGESLGSTQPGSAPGKGLPGMVESLGSTQPGSAPGQVLPGMGESLGSTQSGSTVISLAARTVPVEGNLSIEMLKKEEARLKQQSEQAKKQETDSTKMSSDIE